MGNNFCLIDCVKSESKNQFRFLSAKKFYAPVLISPHLEGKDINVYVVSDRTKPFDAVVSICLMDFYGTRLKNVYLEVLVEPLKSKIYCSLSADTIKKFVRNSRDYFLLCRIRENDKIISENILYPDKIKNLSLPEPEIRYAVEVLSGVLTLIMQSTALVKNMYLYTEEIEGFFSDNYFDLLPGEEKVITWTTSESLHLQDFKNAFRYIYINQN